jgi:hypothetical protein
MGLAEIACVVTASSIECSFSKVVHNDDTAAIYLLLTVRYLQGPQHSLNTHLTVCPSWQCSNGCTKGPEQVTLLNSGLA